MNKLVLGFICLLLLSCEKGSEIPDVPVNFHMSLSDPRVTALNSGGGCVTINGYGISGIIIYRRADNAYVAYDRCSSVEPEKKCAVTIDDPNLTATDPCSGAKFSLFDGAPVKSPAVKPLKRYTVVVTSFDISVFN